MAGSGVGLIGYGSSVYERNSTRTEYSFYVEAARVALVSAGLAKSDIDGLATCSTTLAPDNAVTASEYLGLSPSWAYVSTAGGAGGVTTVLAAVRAVESGAATHVMCLAGAAQSGAFFRERISRFTGAIGDYLAPHGFGGTNGLFGIIQRKHMATYGTTREQLARIAVDQRCNAMQNERALLRKPMTLDDYLNAPVVAEPLGLFDCVMPCSGAEAVIVGPCDRVPSEKRVAVLAGYERHNHPIGQVAPLRGGWELFRDRLYSDAGRGPGEMDFVQVYDDYPIMVAVQLEDLGFCRKGEVGPFLAEHRFTWDGTLPLNTGGGQLSCGQAGGGGGMIGIVEAVCQLRHEAGARQVAAAAVGLISGYGMVSYGHGLSASAMILGRAG